MPLKNSLFVILILVSFMRVIDYESIQYKFYTEDGEETEVQNDYTEGADENIKILFVSIDKLQTYLKNTKKVGIIEFIFLKMSQSIRNIQTPPPDISN